MKRRRLDREKRRRESAFKTTLASRHHPWPTLSNAHIRLTMRSSLKRGNNYTTSGNAEARLPPFASGHRVDPTNLSACNVVVFVLIQRLEHTRLILELLPCVLCTRESILYTLFSFGGCPCEPLTELFLLRCPVSNVGFGLSALCSCLKFSYKKFNIYS